MKYLAWMCSLLFLATVAIGQTNLVPANVIRVNRTITDASDPALHSVEVENTGQQNITAVLLRSEGNCCSETIFSGGPGLEPGKTYQMHVTDTANVGNTEVAAVILEDGTIIGQAVSEKLGNRNLVTEVLEFRKGQAEEWVHWKNLVEGLNKGDPRKAVRDFIAAAEQVQLDSAPDPRSGGRRSVQGIVKGQGQNVAATLEHRLHDEEWVVQNMMGSWLLEHADRAIKLSARQKEVAE